MQQVLLLRMVLIAWLAIFGSTAAIADANGLWWQTECFEPQGNEQGVTVLFRRFNVADNSVDDKSRRLIFYPQAFDYTFGGNRSTLLWKDLVGVKIEKLGHDNPALRITIKTTDGLLSGGPFGIIEFSCWRAMERIINSQKAGIIEGSPPIPKFPVHDNLGNIISDAN